MKKIVILIFFTFILVSCSELTPNQLMTKYVTSYFSNKNFYYEIDEIVKINLTGEDSINNEYFVYFNEINKKNLIVSKSKEGFIFILNEKGKVIYFKPVPFPYMRVDDGTYFPYELKEGFKMLNEGIIYDFNENGKEEFILFTICGSVYQFCIYEYRDGKLTLIAPRNIYNYNLTYLDVTTKSLYLSDRESPEKIKLTWNPETEFYEKEVLEE